MQHATTPGRSVEIQLLPHATTIVINAMTTWNAIAENAALEALEKEISMAQSDPKNPS